ncbi:MAG: hypothetical protein ABF289_05085, partial [Clostridiales bacterium]
MTVIFKKEFKSIIRDKKTLILTIIYLFVFCAAIAGSFLLQNINPINHVFNKNDIMSIYNNVIVVQYIVLFLLTPFIIYLNIKNDLEIDRVEYMKYMDISILKNIYIKKTILNIYLIILYFITIPFGTLCVLFGGCKFNDYLMYSLFTIASIFVVSGISTMLTILFRGSFLSLLVNYLGVVFINIFGFVVVLKEVNIVKS